MTPERHSPLVAQVVLMVLFAILTGVGVVTVVIPELTEDAEAADDIDAAEGSSESE